ncbi:NADH-quinone oxidoreductase subunit A [Fulvivirga lutea]|uniref:NADH-quinone oxidoreductase subunit n=1 Tax=Fulvivirga lutea TaxID=2810512 RepID=A0A974WJG8_9BACT|nr:NADH-quinone oxidoreductase subunit A [Fulvivirga lutea]QSE98918.1 NADH-quinone oxidoreductase subunit A [Fulvivirga lutea]
MDNYWDIVIFFLGGLGFIAGGLITAKLVRPSRPNDEKLTTYESGEDPMGLARGRVNTRFYVIALIFLLFEVEIIFLFPWATVFGNEELINGTNGLWGWFSLIEMFVFIGILGLGLAYVWRKGFLDWPKSEIQKNEFTSPVPMNLYEEINKKYSK